MKIQNILIKDYNVLPRIDMEFKDGFNVIYGPNGSGKTLILNAAKKLFGKRTSRSKDYPRGEILVKEGVNHISFNGERNLEDLVPITADRLNNIFITIDGALDIKDGKHFYEKVVTDLIGINISDIEKVEKNLQVLGRMTDNLKISGDKKYHKPSKQIKEANDIHYSIENFIKDSSWSKERSLEYELIELEKRNQKLELKLVNIEKAKKIKQISDMEEKYNSIEGKKSLFTKKSENEILKQEERVKEFLNSHKEPEYYKNLIKQNNYFWITFLLASIPLFTISGMFYGNFKEWGLLVPLSSFLISIFFFGKGRKMNSDYNNQLAEEKKLLAVAQASRLHIKTIEEFEVNILQLMHELEQMEREISNELAILKHELGKYNSQESLSLENLERFKKFLLSEKELYKMDVEMEYNENDEYRLIEEKGEVINEISKCRKKLEDFNAEIKSLGNRISKLAYEEFMNESFNLEITNIEALERASEKIQELIEKIESDFNCAKEAYEIFEEIYTEESEKIEQYLNEETEISSITEQITDNLFQDITYDSEKELFILKRKGKREQNHEELSIGELSQLYFAIRLALAKRCIDKGFLIFEEPFVYSDDERLEKQLQQLEYLVNDGWQIIIFTAKQAIKELLERKGVNKAVKLERINLS